VIRLGTMIAGDTELGVRLVSILLALPMSFAVYRAAAILFGGRRVAATATVLLNVTLMAAVGTLIVTPDSPLLVASSFVLFFLAKVLETGRGAWWLAVGAAVGAALLSKYTALFFGPAILIWLVSVPKLRRWLISPWPYLGGLVALADIFAGHPLECRSPVGLLHQADRPRADRGFQAGVSSAN
jgi:4-amino-4-deoxy-L-arabinose transferase-like glycosyltransferase